MFLHKIQEQELISVADMWFQSWKFNSNIQWNCRSLETSYFSRCGVYILEFQSLISLTDIAGESFSKENNKCMETVMKIVWLAPKALLREFLIIFVCQKYKKLVSQKLK